MAIKTNIIQARVTGSITDQYVKMGQSCMLRKFDPTVVISGSWNEIWIGFRWRVNLAHSWSGSVSSSLMYANGNVAFNNAAPWKDYCMLSVGVCKTSGGCFGGYLSSSIFHSFGIDSLFFGSAVNATMTSTQSYTQLNLASRTRVMATGSSYFGAQASSPFMSIPCTPRPDQRNYCVVRFVTGSAATSWISHVCTPRFLYDEPTILADDAISSSFIATLFNSPNWSALTTSLGSGYQLGLLNSPETFINQPTNGYFDGVYFTWGHAYDYLEVSDIVIRAI